MWKNLTKNKGDFFWGGGEIQQQQKKNQEQYQWISRLRLSELTWNTPNTLYRIFVKQFNQARSLTHNI